MFREHFFGLNRARTAAVFAILSARDHVTQGAVYEGWMVEPVLSVMVTIVDGGDALRRFLEALTHQEQPPRLEIIVPFDRSVARTEALRTIFPSVIFLDLGVINTARDIRSAAGQHELYDRRRAAGLAAATGDLIAILEDRGVPRRDWARSVVRLHQQPYGVIGGAIEPAGDGGLLHWAFYVCDFGRYGLPFQSGPKTWVSDVNVSYKRRVIQETQELWKERYQEPIVHWALLERGETLYLSSELVVTHHRPFLSLGVLLPERFHWGRLFGHIRASQLSTSKRIAYILLAPAIPLVLLLRHGMVQRRKGRLGRYLRAAPATALLLVAWTTGEVWGYITKTT